MIVRAIPVSAHDIFPAVTEHILTSTTDPEDRRIKIAEWLTCLRSVPYFTVRGETQTEACSAVYDLVAQHFQPSELAEHLSSFCGHDFALVLLRHWVPRYVSTSDRALEGNKCLSATDGRNLRDIYYFHRHRIELIDWPAICNKFHTQTGESGTRGKKRYIIDLVALLTNERIPYAQTLSEIFKTYIQTKSAAKFFDFFMTLRHRENCEIPTPLATQLVQHFLPAGHLSYAFHIFRSVPTIPLLQCPDLPLKLIEQGRTHGAHIFEILNRLTPEDTAPVDLRTNPNLTIKQSHVDLVHQAAYAFASSPHLSARTAFRRVWECSRFLSERSAPLTPMMSRAMVKAGISRFLTEEGRLSATQVKYIISVVKNVEGMDMAKEVDRLVYEFWTGTYPERLRRKNWGGEKDEGREEGFGRFYGGRRRLWRKGGGEVYLPSATPIADSAEGKEGKLDAQLAEAEMQPVEEITSDQSDTDALETLTMFSREMAKATSEEPARISTYLPFATPAQAESGSATDKKSISSSLLALDSGTAISSSEELKIELEDTEAECLSDLNRNSSVATLRQ